MSVTPASASAQSAFAIQPEARGGLADLLIAAACRHPKSGIRMVSGEGGFISYPELLIESRRLLGGLRAIRPAPGSKVLLLLERPADFIPAFWACVLGGYVPCPVAPIRNDPQRWEKHLNHINALLDSPLLVTTHSAGLEIEHPDVVYLDTLRSSEPSDFEHWPELEHPAILVLTSGSTGNSKAVVLTHANLLASMAGKKLCQQLSADDVTLNWISFDHVAALLEAHLLPLYVGATQLHAEAATILADPLLFLRIIDRYRVSMTFAPNFLFGHINAALESAASMWPLTLDLSSLRHVISGGEAIVSETGRRFLDLLAPYGFKDTALWPAFGMTETCAGSVYSREFPSCEFDGEFASLGLPIVGLQMRIVTDRDEPVGRGESGELQLRGPMVFSSYYNNESATRVAFTPDGWFRTGDLGRIDAGRLSLVGRSKDSIIVSGVNYYSQELETALNRLDGIARSYVAAFPTRPQGADTEQLVIMFAPSFGMDDEDKLHQLSVAVRNTTILLWGFRPSIVLPLPPQMFPKSSLGKILRGVLRKKLEEGEFDAQLAYTESVSNRQLGPYERPNGAAQGTVAATFGEMFGLKPSTVGANASFFDLGGTSLDILTLKRKLEQRFHPVAVPIVTILQNPTVKALAARIAPTEYDVRREYDPIVPLQLTGAKTPLFCIHPGVGEVLVFVNLANYFVNDRPFYALRARGFNDGERYFSSFEEMVQTYTSAIRSRQPHGPYALAGYSYGGAVAFEIAKRFEADGEEVAFLSSIDAPPYVMHPMGEGDIIETAATLAFFLSLIDKKHMEELPKELRAATARIDPCAALVAMGPSERLGELDLDLPKFKAWAALAHSLVTIGDAYTATGTVESMTVFYANPLWGTKEEWLTNHLHPWAKLVRQPVRYVEAEGEHHLMLGARHAAGFQALLRSEIDRAMGGR